MGFSSGNIGNSALMLQGGGAAMGMVGAYFGAQSQKTALDGQAAIADINARQSELSAQQELYKGNVAVAQQTQRAGMIKGAQRASMAANGIDLGTGSAAEVLTSTDIMKEQDTNTLTANAVRAAWGYRTQGTNFQNDALMKRASADSIDPLMSGATSLLGSAGSIASNWYNMNKFSGNGMGAAASGDVSGDLYSQNSAQVRGRR